MTNYDTYRAAAAESLQDYTGGSAVEAFRSVPRARPGWIRQGLGLDAAGEQMEIAAELNVLSVDNTERLVECTRSPEEFLVEKQRIDMARWESQISPRDFASRERRRDEANERDLPDMIPTPPSRRDKNRILDLIRSMSPVRSTCRDDLSAPGVPRPIWPNEMPIYTWEENPRGLVNLEWEESSSGCPVSYSVQVQARHLAASSASSQWIHDPRMIVTGIIQNRVTVAFLEGFTGRWRVWAVDSGGRHSQFSTWHHFGFVWQVVVLPTELRFQVAPSAARRGQDVELRLNRADPDTLVKFQGRSLPKRVHDNGQRLVITVPGNATPGVSHFYIVHDGRRFRQDGDFRVLL